MRFNNHYGGDVPLWGAHVCKEETLFQKLLGGGSVHCRTLLPAQSPPDYRRGHTSRKPDYKATSWSSRSSRQNDVQEPRELKRTQKRSRGAKQTQETPRNPRETKEQASPASPRRLASPIITHEYWFCKVIAWFL